MTSSVTKSCQIIRLLVFKNGPSPASFSFIVVLFTQFYGIETKT